MSERARLQRLLKALRLKKQCAESELAKLQREYALCCAEETDLCQKLSMEQGLHLQFPDLFSQRLRTVIKLKINWAAQCTKQQARVTEQALACLRLEKLLARKHKQHEQHQQAAELRDMIEISLLVRGD